MTPPPDERRDEVTVDFDHHCPALSADPYPVYADLRSRCPVAWSPHHDGFWVISDYEGVYTAARDDDTFRSGPSVAIPYMVMARPLIPIETDAPDTQKWRRMLAEEFSPAGVARMEPAIYDLAHDLMDEFIERGHCDFITDFATPVPAKVIIGLLGFDEDRWPEFVDCIHTLVHHSGSEDHFEQTFKAAVALYTAINDAIEDRRQNGFRSDVVSKLAQSTFDGRPVTDDEIADYVMLLLFGGLDTTSASLGNALVRMTEQPHLRAELLAHPELIPNAVEEFLRFDSPLQAIGRNIAHDVEVGGHILRAGERALLIWASANRDPKAFPNPDTIDFHRTENRHLSFIVGLHRCLGSNLGRSIFRVMLELVLTRTPDFELTEDPSRHRFTDIGHVFALHGLPARFSPGLRRRSPMRGADQASADQAPSGPFVRSSV